MIAALFLFLQAPGNVEAEALLPAASAAVEAELESPPPPASLVLRSGTPVRLRLLDELSTARTQKGETFELEVIDDVRVDGWLVIPAGTRAKGEVTRSDAKGAFGKSGKLEAVRPILTFHSTSCAKEALVVSLNRGQ